MTAAAIEAEGLTKYYGDFAAVDRIDFSVAAGTTTALLGGNGAGKTTTLSMLLGLLLPSAGRITVLGEDMLRHRYRALPRMNFTSPYVDLPYRLTVEQNLLVYGRLYGVPRVRRRVHRIAAEMELTGLLGRHAGTLSAGQKTRVALAKSLLNEPALLLMDEPTASLDPDMAEAIRGYLVAYQRRTGATILLASHNMTEVERICDDVIMMRTGRVVDRGTPAALLEKYGRRTMEEVFLDIARHGEEPGPITRRPEPAASEAPEAEEPAERRRVAP